MGTRYFTETTTMVWQNRKKTIFATKKSRFFLLVFSAPRNFSESTARMLTVDYKGENKNKKLKKKLSYTPFSKKILVFFDVLDFFFKIRLIF